MKALVKKSIIFMLVSLFVVSISAQEQGKRQKMTAEERATKQTEMMTKQLTLTADQQTKIQAINLKYAQQMDANMQKAKENEVKDREAMKAQMKTQMDAKDAEMKQVLTSDQYKQWEEKKQEMKGKMDKKMNGKKHDREKVK